MELIGKIEGGKDLRAQLMALESSAQAKVARQSVSSAATPAMKEIRNSAPVGKNAHKTYKGRIVAPGFTRRNIAKKSWISKDRTVAGVSLSVRQEAFYSLLFIEKGTRHIAPNPWFEPAFYRARAAMLQRLGAELRKKIEKALQK